MWNHQNEGPLCPAPLAPWQRPNQSPFVEVLSGNGNINLGPSVTSWLQSQPQGDGKPYVLALPNGNAIGQAKTIQIPAATAAATAPFYVTGQFANCTCYLFNSAATYAIFCWDGQGWQLAGGNAQPSNSAPTP